MNSEQHVCHPINILLFSPNCQNCSRIQKKTLSDQLIQHFETQKVNALPQKKKRLGDQSMITPHSFHNLHYPRKSAVNRKSRRPHTSCHYIHLCLMKLWVILKGPGFQSYKRIVGTHSVQNFLKTLEENKCIWQTFCAYFAKILP